MQHYPVLLAEALDYLAIRPEGVYVDTTTGLAGHSLEIARQLESGRLIALDRDAESLELAKERAGELAARITFQKAAFSELTSTLTSLGVSQVDGILSDLGISMLHLRTVERGFSFQSAGPLDMRLDREQPLTAADVVNRSTEEELSNLFFELAEERRLPRKLARAIVRSRPIRDTAHLAEVIGSVLHRTGKLHPATRIFQAIRMAVNDEPGELDALLEQAPALLKPGGRMVVIAFQSLDDRKVKRRFQTLAKEGVVRILTKHVVKPGEAEVRQNPPSRSAVLRAVEKRTSESESKRDN